MFNRKAKKTNKVPYKFSDFLHGFGMFTLNAVGLTIEIFWFPAFLAAMAFFAGGGLDIITK